MSLLQCSQCEKDISATHKICPHCGSKISFILELKSTIEKSRLRQIAVAIFVFFMLGTAWYLGKSTGYRWPLYVVVIACAPLVPWLLQLAYKSAAPVEEAESLEPTSSSHNQAQDTSEEQKIWRG